MKNIEVNKENIEIYLFGGPNVPKRKYDTIGKNNLDSISKFINENHIEVKVKSVESLERITVLFDIGKGCINYTVGDLKQKKLWLFRSNY